MGKRRSVRSTRGQASSIESILDGGGNARCESLSLHLAPGFVRDWGQGIGSGSLFSNISEVELRGTGA